MKEDSEAHIRVEFGKINIEVQFKPLSIPVLCQFQPAIEVPVSLSAHISSVFEMSLQVSIMAVFEEQIRIDQQFSSDIDIVSQFEPEIQIEVQMSFHVEVQFQPEIHIDSKLNLTNQDLMVIHELVSSKKEARVQKIVRLHYAMEISVREISETLGVGRTQIYDDLKEFKARVLKALKSDLRANKKVLGHMVGLMAQIQHQVRILWDKYNQLEADSTVLRRGLREAYQNRKEGEAVPIGELAALALASRATLQIHDRQQAYLVLLRQETLTMLQVWERFGLTGEDAVKLILSGGVDIDAKVTEVKTTLIKLTQCNVP